MTDEIRPARIPSPRYVKSVSREDHDDDEGRFRKELAEAAGEEEEQRSDAEDQDSEEPEHADDAERQGPREDDGKLGRNIDLRT
jgi:hypothetical protein